MGTVILACEGLTEYLNNRAGWVVCHIFEHSNSFSGQNRKEPPKARLMTMEELDSDSDPNEDHYRIGAECHLVNSVNPVIQRYRIRRSTES